MKKAKPKLKVDWAARGYKYSVVRAQFYESCATGVGDYFLDSILSDLDSLVLFAGVHPIHFGFHRMLSKRFPFGIYYEMEVDVVYVYAILDLRRTPLLIRKQLRKKIDCFER